MDIVDEENINIIIEYLKEKGILAKEGPMCGKCNLQMVLKPKENNIDKVAWKCPKCTTICSIRNNSFLQGFNKPLTTFIKLIFHWAIQTVQIDFSNTITNLQASFKCSN